MNVFRKIGLNILRNGNINCQNNFQSRTYAVRKRFYKRTGILSSDGKYEITLDQKKLKTPGGNIFTVSSEPLALAVAAEWDAQKENISLSQMHLTSLCNTIIDNPNKLDKFTISNYMVRHLQTDTLLFQSGEDDALYKFQIEKWDPVLDWFRKRYDVDIEKTRNMEAPEIYSNVMAVVSKQILSYDFASVIAFSFGVDALKSTILMLACINKFVTPESAVLLSRLEEEFQSGFWGRVEWAHDLSQQDLQARLAAALFLVQCQSSSTLQQSKVAKKASQ